MKTHLREKPSNLFLREKIHVILLVKYDGQNDQQCHVQTWSSCPVVKSIFFPTNSALSDLPRPNFDLPESAQKLGVAA